MRKQWKCCKPVIWYWLNEGKWCWTFCTFLWDTYSLSIKRQREIFKLEVLSTMQACSCRSFVICLYMETNLANQVKGHCSFHATCLTCNFWQILNLLQSSILTWSIRCSSHHSFFKSILRLNFFLVQTMKMRSSHDVLQDPKLSSQPVVENTAEPGNLKVGKDFKSFFLCITLICKSTRSE